MNFIEWISKTYKKLSKISEKKTFNDGRIQFANWNLRIFRQLRKNLLSMISNTYITSSNSLGYQSPVIKSKDQNSKHPPACIWIGQNKESLLRICQIYVDMCQPTKKKACFEIRRPFILHHKLELKNNFWNFDSYNIEYISICKA